MSGELLELPAVGPAPPDTARVLAELAGLARRHHLAEVEQRCLVAGLQSRLGEFDVAVFGQFKAGKSSLLNSLLGHQVLPVQAIPATAVITRVRYGTTLCARVKPRDSAPRPLPLSQLGQWVTQTGNPGNRRGAEWVEVQSPALADLAGLTLIDTPGTGSSWEANTAVSLDWLPNAGAALVAISGSQPLADRDLRLIELLQPHTPHLMVVLTKTDLLRDEDADAVLAHVRSRLATRFPEPPPVWQYSIADGHQELRDRLRELADGQAAALEQLTRHRITRLTTDTRAYLELARAAAAGHDRAVAELRRVLSEERARLPAVRVQAHAQLQPVIQRLHRHAEKLFGRELPRLVQQVGLSLERVLPGWHGSLAGETRAFRCWLGAELNASLAPLIDTAAAALAPLAAEGLEPVRQIGQAYVQRLRERVQEALGTDLQLPVPTPVAAGRQLPQVHLNAVFDSHLELLSWAVPMVLARPLVHRHFRRMVPWQVEKNLYRASYATSGQAVAGLRQCLDAYLEVLAEQVDLYQRLTTEPGDLPGLEQDLAAIQLLGAPPWGPGQAGEATACPRP